MNFLLELNLLILLFAANSAPVIAARCLGDLWRRPLDGGRIMSDGNPLFGSSKTWRGIVAALLFTGIAAWAMGLTLVFGLLFGFFAMLGDLFSSFIKRRLGKPPSSQALVLDHLPEALVPLVYASWSLNYSWIIVVFVALVFMLTVLLVSPILFKLGIRKKPY